jgi:hypothetical protein
MVTPMLSALFASVVDVVISYAIDKLVPFLNHCVDLIFLRRVGGGYIFVHRLLMEHFAEMYVETPTSKGN